MSKLAVIIPAAGKSERFGGKEKKIFAKLDNRPVFLRTLEKFVTRDDVAQVILAVSPEDDETVRTKFGPNLGFMGVKLVKGGEHRSDTVRAALTIVDDDVEYVAIHDAARPCITPDRIDAVFAEARKSGAALLASPVSSTLKRVSEAGVVDATVSRDGLYEAQTPQVFKKDLLESSLDKSELEPATITDECMVVEAAGHPVSVVKSDATNLKITTPGDLTLAAAIIKSMPKKPISKFGAFEEAQW
ncbi:MAG: 2-C-methyl-D-erythritol 4-phosphate cytidylyltransferase [Phycisphaerae bacterium]